MADEVKRALQVHVEHAVKGLLLHHRQQAVLRDPSVVYQDIDGTKVLLDLVHRIFDCGKVRHIAAIGDRFHVVVCRALGAEGFRQLLVARVNYGHVGSLAGKLLHDSSPDPTGAARHQGDFSGKVPHALTSCTTFSRSSFVASG